MIKLLEGQAIIQRPERILKATLLVAFICLFNLSGVSWGATYEVGPGQPYPTIGSVPPLGGGDVVKIHSGTYNEVKKWTDSGTDEKNPITLRGVVDPGKSRPIIDAAGQNVTGKSGTPRAAWEIQGNFYVIENLEFKNARNGNNGAGIRVLFANTTTVRNCKITYCDMGMMSSSNDKLLVENSEVAFNGTSRFNGYSHNFYLGGGNTTVQFCYIHDALYGQNFKTRGHYTNLLYNYIADSNEGEVGPVDATETAVPNSNMAMIGNLVISKPDRTGNTTKFIDFGQDSGGSHNGTLYLINNTLIAGSPKIGFLSASATDSFIVAVNNIFYGSNTIVQAGFESRVSGNDNWIPQSATIPPGFDSASTIRGSDPGFVDALLRDYYLTSTSPCRNQGSNSTRYVDGGGFAHSVVPDFEYVRHVNNAPRLSDGLLDIGAFEDGNPLPNQPPFVSAGPDQTVPVATGANLSGAFRDDGLPDPRVTVAWSITSGPGTVTFGDPNATDTRANFSRKGTYVLRLTADDSALSDFDEVTIVVTR
ncbi:MAG: hypothetical protein DMG06_16190 [Acidobacteria bacterium]|nr:MAG: hypothetical protein DMG06_16190 [Acidobacteriota bacterium]